MVEAKSLNAKLAESSYVGGVTPSGEDVEAFKAIAKAPGKDTPHLLRWWNHIKSFSAAETGAWPKAGSSGGAAAAEEEEDDDVDLFGESDEEDDEAKEKLKQERLAAYAAKKAKKPALVPKSTIILDVKPWDDETDLRALEKLIRGIEKDGLNWAAAPAQIKPVAYGINKIQIGCVVEDDKVGTDFLEESITAFEEFVQSVDIVAFQKI